MPNYSYACNKCETDFELYSTISDYKPSPKCPHCGYKKTSRKYTEDLLTLNSSVRKSDNELKTLGDLAMRNTERMSDDQKQAIWQKNNAYKEEPCTKPLPKGMSRIKKPPKPKWR